MEKLLPLLLCVPLIFSCVNEKTNKDDNKSKENNTTKLETTFNGSISVSTYIEDNMDDNTHSLYQIEESEDNIENVIAILKSYDLAKETIESLPFDTSSQKIEELTRKYVNSLQIIRLEDSDVFELSIRDNSIESVNYLNTLVRNYIDNDTEKRKEASGNVVRYIDNEIQLLQDSLLIIDIKLKNYKASHQTLEVNNKKSDFLFEKISKLEINLSKYKYQNKYYSYLEDYINNGDELERVINPFSHGVTNDTLSELIKQLVNTQLEKNILIDYGQKNNPSIADFDLQIKQLSSNIKELIKTSKKVNLLIIDTLNNKLQDEVSTLSSLPIEQRELLDIQRTQNISESLYLFLQEKKYEARSRHEEIISNINHREPAILIIE